MDRGAWWDLQSMESQRVRYDLAAEHVYTHTHMYTCLSMCVLFGYLHILNGFHVYKCMTHVKP